MLPEVLSFGKVVAQSCWYAASAAFVGGSAQSPRWGTPCSITVILLGTRCCGKESCSLVGARRIWEGVGGCRGKAEAVVPAIFGCDVLCFPWFLQTGSPNVACVHSGTLQGCFG